MSDEPTSQEERLDTDVDAVKELSEALSLARFAASFTLAREAGRPAGWRFELAHLERVKSYAPRVWHVVADVRVTRVASE